MTSTISSQTDQPTTDEAIRLEVAGRFIDGLVARDFAAVADTLVDDVSFRALLPS